MVGVILETLNAKKLIAFGVFILIAQTSFFLIGGLISPAPNTHEQILLSKCVDRENRKDKWFFLRPHSSNQTCREILDDDPLEEIGASKNITADNIVFVAQFPHPRSGFDLKMTRWFQQVIAVLNLDIKQKYNIESHSKLGSADEFKFYDCEVLPLFTLGSCHHENYLVNIRIPMDIDNKVNHEIGLLQDVWMVEIHQNGGFTMVSFNTIKR
ncbi:unnamed protein product [Rodentolepis nana]|uniref:Wntless GOLD domain-containing protein n=1 Tax=Rodentolepis nana TaxID=102285 RepID=A0A0R3TWR7_RODNA|nr:unnamed protein product [Rodentolepis nana]